MTLSLVHPIAFRSSLTTGAMGAVPVPHMIWVVSNPSSFSLKIPVSTTLPETWTEPTILAVGATSATVFSTGTLHSSAMNCMTFSSGIALDSRAMTVESNSSSYCILSYVCFGFSESALAGPEPMAKYLSTLTCQPAFWAPRQDIEG